MIKDITIPEISENVTSGTVVAVLVETGDDVRVDDTIIEFETDKAVVEIPSPFDGRITEVLVQEGDEMNVGEVIAKIDTEKGAVAEEGAEEQKRESGKAEPEGAAEKEETPEEETARESPERREEAEAAEEEEEKKKQAEDEKAETAEPERKTGGEEEKRTPEAEEKRPPADRDKRAPAAASPSVRRFARELGIDIHAVEPAGPGERISESDVKAYVKRELAPGGEPAAAASAFVGGTQQPELPDFSRWGEVETRELTSVRRLTAGSVAASWQTVVHVTQFERVDITAALEFMDRNADKVADRGGKLTITAVLMKICAVALKRFPAFNATIDPANNRLILKKYVHIGLAVDTPRGLLVPVVRNVDRKSILELAVEIVDLARRARNKKIKPDEMEGGTFTISNQGGIGGTNFTPVVFWPQAAILGVSRASTEPVYVDGEFRPRTLLPLALSYDHRIADGADAARFARWIRDGIEHPLTLHLG